jgi:hypothetical protein
MRAGAATEHRPIFPPPEFRATRFTRPTVSVDSVGERDEHQRINVIRSRGRFRWMPTVRIGENSKVDDGPLERLRRICLALPETTERLSHGEPTWFVRGKKTFVSFADHHHDDRLAFWCAAPPGAQQALVTEDPRRFFVPSYVGGRGWIGIRLDVPTDWAVVAELVEDAYRTVAPRRLVAGLDTSGSGSAPDREIG